MMTKIPGVSVVIPTARTDRGTLYKLLSVLVALNSFNGLKELVIVADRKLMKDDFLRGLSEKSPFVKLLETGGGKGSAYTRLKAIQESQYQTVLFTDDDCVVPSDWVVHMYQEVAHHGIVSGDLSASRTKNIFSSVDAYVDQLRIRSKDEFGATKYISFPNFGIDRKHLPKIPFLANPLNTAEDIELACWLRLADLPIYFDETIVVTTEYPTTFNGLLRRKIKHAKGIAFLRSRLGVADCRRIGLSEKPWRMLLRWSRLSLKSPLTLAQKFYMGLANVAYCTALAYYDNKFYHQNTERTPT